MLLVIGPLCGLGLVDAFEVGLVGVISDAGWDLEFCHIEVF